MASGDRKMNSGVVKITSGVGIIVSDVGKMSGGVSYGCKYLLKKRESLQTSASVENEGLRRFMGCTLVYYQIKNYLEQSIPK